MTPTAEAIQAAAQGMTTFEFVLAILDRVLPILRDLTPAIGALALAVAGYITIRGQLLKNQVSDIHKMATGTQSEIVAARAELQEVRGEVNGKIQQFLETTKDASFAAGTAHGVAIAAQTLPTPIIQVIPPDAMPGGHRRTDPPGTAPSKEEFRET